MPTHPAFSGLTIVIPVHNEQESLNEAVRTVHDSAVRLTCPWEIILVDDGSTDGTAALGEGLARELTHVSIIHHAGNRRIGAAVQTGAKAAQHPWVIVSPVDSPLEHEGLNRFLSASEGVDLVVGYRLQRQGYALKTKILSQCYWLMLRTLFGVNFKDFGWISLYKKELFERLGPFSESGVFFPEILIKAVRKGCPYREIHSEMKPRRHGRGTVSQWKNVFDLFREILKLKLG